MVGLDASGKTSILTLTLTPTLTLTLTLALALTLTRYNELTSPIVRAAGIPILPVWEPSLPHHRAHVGWKPLRGGRTLDCTHFCLASGLLDHWVELLMATMLPSLTR